MKLPKFDRPIGLDPVLVDRLEEFFKGMEDCPLIGGREISNVAITSGTTKKLNHGLGRTPQGWFVTRKNANAVVYEVVDPDSEKLQLDASATVTVSLWVY